VLRKEAPYRKAPRASGPAFSILPKPPERERNLWRFLTWPFILAQILAAEQFFATAAKAAQDDDGASHPQGHTDPKTPYDDPPKDPGLSQSDEPAASQAAVLLVPSAGGKAQQSDGNQAADHQIDNAGQSQVSTAGHSGDSSSDGGAGGGSSSSSSPSPLSDLAHAGAAVESSVGSFVWGLGPGIESTTLSQFLGYEPVAKMLGIQPILDFTGLQPLTEPIQGTVQFFSQTLHSTLHQVTGIQLIPNTEDVLTQLGDDVDSAVSQITGLQLIGDITSLLTNSATQVLDAVDHTTDLVTGSLGTLTTEATHLVMEAANQASNVLGHTLDSISGSLEALTKDTVATLADQLNQDANVATQTVDSGLDVLASIGSATAGLLTHEIAQGVSLVSHAAETVAATVGSQSSDTAGLFTDEITQSGSLVSGTADLGSSTLHHEISQGTSMAGNTTEPTLGTVGAQTMETPGLLTNAVTQDAVAHTIDAVESTDVTSGLSHTTGGTEELTTLNTTLDNVSANFGGNGDIGSSQNVISTTSAVGELQPVGGAEPVTSSVSSLDGALGSVASSSGTPQEATDLTALHQSGDVSSGVIPISAPPLATVSQADDLFTGGQHTDYGLALQSNTDGLSQTSTVTSVTATDVMASATDVTSGDTSMHQSSSTDTHSSSTSTDQQNLDTSLLTSNTLDELGSRDHALI
jgi:hypothetical protein